MSTISVRVLQAIVAQAAVQGVEPERLLAAAGIEPAALDDDDARLPRALETRLWYEAARMTGDEVFGLHLSEWLPIERVGALGFAVRSSATLGEAYTRTLRYFRLVADGPVLDLQMDGALVTIRHTPPAEPPAPARHAVESLLATLVMLARHGVGEFEPRLVRFRHGPPASLDEHRRLLGPAVRFDQPHDEIAIDRALWSLPQRQAEPALSAVLDQHLSAQLSSLPAGSGFVDEARAAVAAALAQGEPTLEAVAAQMKMSPRSLQRRFQREQTSLSGLVDSLRADLAVRSLSEPRVSIADVAFLLGFSEVSTFHRAFKRWTGLTPAAYRRSRRSDGSSA